MTRRLVMGLCAAALSLSVGAGVALAGEVTGSGVQEDQNQGMSWCSFSGLNDRLPGDGNATTQAQAFGQDVSASVHAGTGPLGGVPGTFCNPTKSPLGPNPNRTR